MSPTILWLIAGAVFIGVEIFGMPGIGFLFAGVGALLIGGGIEFGLIAADDTLLQFVLFFITACGTAALLWKQLKSRPRTPYSGMIGTEATVVAPGLAGNKDGQVRWSGTLMRARLVHNDGLLAVPADAVVVIKQVDGNLLIVAPTR